jgi:hypothetical protein
MKIRMEWVALFACVLGGWSMLRLIGGERQRRVDELAIKARIEAEERKRENERVRSTQECSAANVN